MDDERYVEVVEENNSLPYAAFCHRIRWKVAEIAGRENADGYIVQRIHYIDTVGAAASSEDYYEAWKVERGVCKPSGACGYDDGFELDVNYSCTPLRRSIGREGYIRYEAKVHWVDRADSLYETVSAWPQEVPMAGGLNAVLAEKCPELEGREPRFFRSFEHRFDCRSEQAVEESLRSAYGPRIARGAPELKATLHELLDGTEYTALIEKLLADQALPRSAGEGNGPC